MPSSKYLLALLSIAITSLSLTNSQLVASLPDCIQDCIEKSPDINCSTLDVPCLCRASSGNFLPDIITCMHAQCDNNLDNNLLLFPLQLACQLAGSPIPSSAIRNAQNIGSSLASQGTTTITMHDSSSSLIFTSTPTSHAPLQSVTSSPGFTLTTKNPPTQTSTLYPYLGTRPSTQGIGPSTSSSGGGSVTQVTGTKTPTPTGTGTVSGSGTQTGQSQGTSTGSKSAAAPPNSVETNGSPFQDGNKGCRNGISGWLVGLSFGFILGGLLL